MSDVKYDFIVREIERVKQRDGRLHRAEIGCEMPAALHYGIVYKITQLIAQHVELAMRIVFNVLRRKRI